MFKIGAWIDNLLNSITMYRLVLYILISYAVLSIIFGAFNIINYSPVGLLISLFAILATCLFFNIFYSKLFRAATNVESVYITALILYFIMIPAGPGGVLFAVFASFLAISSKFVLAIKMKNIFNPAAIAAVLLGALGIGFQLWWIGVPAFLPFTVIGGILIVRKIRKFGVVLSFLFVATLTALVFGFIKGGTPAEVLAFMYTSGPIIFFASIMFIEPATTPPTFKKQLIYSLIVGVLYGSQFRIGPLFSSPELALIIGNIYSYFVSQKEKLILTLISTKEIAKDTYEFVFRTSHKFSYIPGQYLEWTLSHKHSDSRGVRRYFTIASSPSEQEVKLGVKVEQNSSSFKKALVALKTGDQIMAGQLSGDFLLPKDTNKKLVFMAGGIGITPFRSMIKNLLDKNETRHIVLFYSNKTADEIAYREIFDKAQKNGVIAIYVLTDIKSVPKMWGGESGHINEAMVKKYVPDYKKSTFYLSGPNAMVHAYKELLVGMGATDIVTDYFPGY